MNLRTLVESQSMKSCTGALDRPIHRIVSDSRQAGDGAMFVAIRGGQEADRHVFVDDAVRRGAAAVLVEDEGIDAAPATCIVVDDTRRALAAIAATLYGHPARAMRCVGVTGTNGKSTTALILQHVLSTADTASAYVGTLGFSCGTSNPREVVANTTPEAGELQALLARARDAGCGSLAMEVSSHGLALGRVQGIDFAAAVFTNLTRDHLDFHGTEEAYFAAKRLLFEQLNGSAVAVLNAWDVRAPALAASTPARVWTYGAAGADVALRTVAFGPRGMGLTLDTPAGVFEVESALTGRFNCANVVAAVTTGMALGIEADAIRQAVAAVTDVPGRFERIDAGQDYQVIVDYAHSPAGLETVLQAARELTAGKLICVFGCGGDRDSGKRPMMGRVAEQLADQVVLTSDNPRSESPPKIIEQIAAGMHEPASVLREPDRRTAICVALDAAGPGDVVVIAGKGDEPYQLLDDGQSVPFDDRLVAREALCR